MTEADDKQDKKKRSPFPPLYWLVVLFEFFERGAYYGMMSVLSVYLTDELHFAKTDVGIIKGTIQPLLYFLPIISGALADRFGYRRTLMVAFSLLGGGYFLTSQATEYAWVFLALVVMGLGAGTFKPVISGTIARCTDETNSTLGFGIFYWSINLGAGIFPMFLVPYLKNNIGWPWVMVASAIFTGAMLLPTIFVFREPPAPKDADASKAKPDLLQTLANAFEIIYSLFVLLHHLARRSAVGVVLILALLAGTFGLGGWLFVRPQEVIHVVTTRSYTGGEGTTLRVRLKRDLTKPQAWAFAGQKKGQWTEQALTSNKATLILHQPEKIEAVARELLGQLHERPPFRWVNRDHLRRFARDSGRRVTIVVTLDAEIDEPYRLVAEGKGRYRLILVDADLPQQARVLLMEDLGSRRDLGGISGANLEELAGKAGQHPFLLIFVGMLLLASQIVLRLSHRFKRATAGGKAALLLLTIGALEGVIWGLQLSGYLSIFAAILCGVISITVLSLYTIDHDDAGKFGDHFKFLLMIAIYSGFWVLYFQMFDSVLWYVQAYVDASSLNAAVSHIKSGWWFDVEHVTVINAATIIIGQLLVSHIVKNTRAMPTMIAGIAMGTLGMGILAISTSIWVFLAGIVIFSIGEMTAHPKFISYVGQTAPKSRVAMYMGYLFLYGVIGSSIGGVVGANLYVRFVDELNQPRTLWLIFSSIGVATIVGLLIYNAVFSRKKKGAPADGDNGDDAGDEAE